MAIIDDDLPKKPVAHLVGEDLSPLSVAEIDRRVLLLEGEITRLKTERAKKDASRSAAEAFFRS